jgi:hypothetical protein
MTNALDERFREAITAIDAGDVETLDRLLAAHPELACQRLDTPGAWLRAQVGDALDGFFNRPYLLWFVAEDPVRNTTLPTNIVDITRTILRAIQHHCPQSAQEQLDYAIQLVSWSGVANEARLQIPLVDVLLDAGASPQGSPDNALVNGNVAAAKHLADRGAPLTLGSALVLGRWDDADRLAPSATPRDRQLALTLAALRGNAEAVRRLIAMGVDVDAPSPDLYAHATPLHHAVYSGSIDAVKALVEAGARLDVRDTAHDSTPLGWAEYSGGKKAYDDIAAYLREVEEAR